MDGITRTSSLPFFSNMSLHLDVVSHATSRYSITYGVHDLNIEYAQPGSVVIMRLRRNRIVISDRHKLLSRESFRQTFEWKRRRRLTTDFKASLLSSILGGCEYFGWRLSSMFLNFSLKRKRELDARFERFSYINFNCFGIFDLMRSVGGRGGWSCLGGKFHLICWFTDRMSALESTFAPQKRNSDKSCETAS